MWDARGGPQSLYASCFGAVDVDQLKLTLFQNSLGATGGLLASAKEKAAQIVELIGSVTAAVGSKTVGDVGGMVGSLGGLLQSTVVDAVLKDRLVVLDDLERRAPALRIDAVMGFIDQLRRSGCRVPGAGCRVPGASHLQRGSDRQRQGDGQGLANLEGKMHRPGNRVDDHGERGRFPWPLAFASVSPIGRADARRLQARGDHSDRELAFQRRSGERCLASRDFALIRVESIWMPVEHPVDD